MRIYRELDDFLLQEEIEELKVEVECSECEETNIYTGTEDEIIDQIRRAGWVTNPADPLFELCYFCAKEQEYDAKEEERMHRRDVNSTIRENLGV